MVRIILQSMSWPLTFQEKPHPEGHRARPLDPRTVHMVNAGRRGYCWTAGVERHSRQAAEEPAKGGCWGHLCRAQLVPVSPGCPSQGQLSCPVYTGTDLPSPLGMSG